MAVGAKALTFFEGQDIRLEIPVSISGVSDITGWDIELVVKETAAELDPPLLGPVTCSTPGGTMAVAEFYLDLAPGKYVYSVRRVDEGSRTQLAQAALTVLDSASVDYVAP